MTNNKLTDKHIAEILDRAEVCDDSVLTDYADIAAAMRELQERRKADSEPVMYVMGWGEALDAETASTCKGAVDSWVGEWNQERLPGQADYKTVPLYRHAQSAPVAPEIIPNALRDEIIDLCSGYEIGDLGAQEIWEACRSVMISSTKRDKTND
jgi:hypothetical protein